jgi:hypothetical protein
MAGGPSLDAIARELAPFEREFAERLELDTIEFVLPAGSKRAQEVLYRQFAGQVDKLSQSDLGLANQFSQIEGDLADLLIRRAASADWSILSLLPRCEGGVLALANLLDQHQLLRLGALAALARLGPEAKFANEQVRTMFDAAAVDCEREFISEVWSAVNEKFVATL